MEANKFAIKRIPRESRKVENQGCFIVCYCYKKDLCVGSESSGQVDQVKTLVNSNQQSQSVSREENNTAKKENSI